MKPILKFNFELLIDLNQIWLVILLCFSYSLWLYFVKVWDKIQYKPACINKVIFVISINCLHKYNIEIGSSVIEKRT